MTDDDRIRYAKAELTAALEELRQTIGGQLSAAAECELLAFSRAVPGPHATDVGLLRSELRRYVELCDDDTLVALVSAWQYALHLAAQP